MLRQSFTFFALYHHAEFNSGLYHSSVLPTDLFSESPAADFPFVHAFLS